MSSSHEATYARGSDLSEVTQRHCLAKFTDRYTGDHKPAWAEKVWKDGRTYALQFVNDAEWLANTFFAVTPAGFLDREASSCHAQPTWPNNPELRTHAA